MVSLERIASKLMQIYSLAEKKELAVVNLELILDIVISKQSDILLSGPERKKEILSDFVADFFEKNKRLKICIVGECNIPRDQILGMAKSFGIPSDVFEFHFQYENVKKTFHIENIVHNKNYLALIYGQVPHKLVGQDCISLLSFVEKEMSNNLIVIESRDLSGGLSLNKTSLKRSFELLCLKILGRST
ncbi:hypothetical protein K8Q94_01795 [Candidatus Nomurabacteria bacterium]|nr:hypothetical protein [Candidatus Nomurabacteria bacterium]